MDGRCKSGNTLQFYLNPEREIDEAAVEVHGITSDKLADKPCFNEKAEELLRSENPEGAVWDRITD